MTRPPWINPWCDYLLANRSSAEFLVAVEGAQSAESIIIATGQPVMALRGFSGSDPWPTLAQFQELVTAGKVRYVLIGGSQSGVLRRAPAGSPGERRRLVALFRHTAMGGAARHGRRPEQVRWGFSGGTLYRLW